ncbi:hypothetical protein [Rickettsia bellii]|uniref:Uncharacterized protein n=1 Tax=Rickettsia bellii (strain RML369-C) TaxID=336407 RepID=Q1RJ38_RICBR|nr:hypothetical protein [Rickettsia bellii]ABE04626.1 unknown [Rickettsia bellii RML369-C]
MADDGDNKKDVSDKKDDTQVKNDNLSKSDDNQTQNKKDDAQVKNELNAIRAQVTATNNPAELARLASAAAGLAASTNNRELLDQIKNLQSSISKREENAEQIIYSEDSEKGLNMEGQGNQYDHEAAREQELHDRHERLKAGHDQFMKEADEFIESKRQEKEKWQALLNDMKAGKEIDPERLKALDKTEAQLKDDQNKRNALKEYHKKATEHSQQLKAEEDRLKKQQAQDIKAAEEQRNANSKLAVNSKELEQGQIKLASINARIEQTGAKLSALSPKIAEATKIQADAYKQVEKERKEIQELRIEAQKEAKKDLQKYSAINDFSELLLNQTKSVETNELKDNELRNEFLSKENKKEPEIRFPSKPSSDVILPGKDEILPTSQKSTSAEAVTATKKLSQGEEALKLSEERPVSSDKINKFTNKIKSSLEKQQSSVSSNKETQVNKLARTNQQNKKNDKGHSR